MEPRRRKPLRRPPAPGVDLDSVAFMSIGGPNGYCTDSDWKEWRAVVRSLREAVRERNFAAPLPRCRSPEYVEAWLEEVNFLIGRAEHFPDGKIYELIDLDEGSDAYRILLCRKGYKFPKSIMYKGNEDEST